MKACLWRMSDTDEAEDMVSASTTSAFNSRDTQNEQLEKITEVPDEKLGIKR